MREDSRNIGGGSVSPLRSTGVFSLRSARWSSPAERWAPDLSKLTGSLEDRDSDAGLVEPDGGRQTAQTGADDQDVIAVSTSFVIFPCISP